MNPGQIVLHGGPLGGVVAIFPDDQPGVRAFFDDPSKPESKKKLIYELRQQINEDTDETSLCAVFVGIGPQKIPGDNGNTGDAA